jgi:H2-forming N5,N10-methylenetetrahydromethanopterin dehydrogenase-like enzyme
MNSDEFEPWIAIRYLGTILASSSFWAQQPHANHQFATNKLFQRVVRLVNDMDMECFATTDVRLRKINGDIEGIDLLTSALLHGVEDWYRRKESRPSGPALNNFQQLMVLVRQ